MYLVTGGRPVVFIIRDGREYVKNKFSKWGIFQRVPQRGYKASGAALAVAAVGGAWVGVGVVSVVYVRFSHKGTLTAVVMVFPGRVVPTVMEVTSSPTYEFLHYPTPIFPCDFKAFEASKSPIQNQWLPLKDTSFLDNFQSQVF